MELLFYTKPPGPRIVLGKRSLHRLMVLCATLALAAFANATPVVNSTITILGTSSSAFSGYGTAFALDSGAPQFLTDFASNGQGNATHLDFDFGSPLTFDSILFTDRTSSGGANGSNVRGVFDFVVSYQFIFSTDSTFGDAGDTTVNVGPRTVPSAGAVLSAFQTTTSISNVTARYVRWQVISAPGANPGAADFQFDVVNSVPEPGTLFSVAIGLAILALGRRPGRLDRNRCTFHTNG